MTENNAMEFEDRVALKAKLARLESETAGLKAKLASAQAERDSFRFKTELAVAFAESGFNKRVGLKNILAVATDGIEARASRAEDALMIDDSKTGKPYSNVAHYAESFRASNGFMFDDAATPAKTGGVALPADWRTASGWSGLSPEQKQIAREELAKADGGGGFKLPAPSFAPK